MVSDRIPDLRVIALGAGWESTVMALRGDAGEFGPKPDCAIFADTHWEPPEVYRHLEWLRGQLSFPVYVVEHRNLKEDATNLVDYEGREKILSLPLYLTGGEGGITTTPMHRPLQGAPDPGQDQGTVGDSGASSGRQGSSGGTVVGH